MILQKMQAAAMAWGVRMAFWVVIRYVGTGEVFMVTEDFMRLNVFCVFEQLDSQSGSYGR